MLFNILFILFLIICILAGLGFIFISIFGSEDFINKADWDGFTMWDALLDNFYKQSPMLMKRIVIFLIGFLLAGLFSLFLYWELTG
ncbi:hypothetical protein [Alkalihalobacillus deserti]|uniref:hypothetical protein n=1 Tax=Alkalihalobacillus deserti TaxID=2879466 RepID=UPI001D1542C6|nr:hypothetical protein [Alkalihalobacillus deserti]